MGRQSIAAIILLAFAGTASAEQKRDIRGFVTGMSEAEVEARLDLQKCRDSKNRFSDDLAGREIKCPQQDKAELTIKITSVDRRIHRLSIYVPRSNPDGDQLLKFIEHAYSIPFPKNGLGKAQIPGTSDWLDLSWGSSGFTVTINAPDLLRENILRENQIIRSKGLARPLPKL